MPKTKSKELSFEEAMEKLETTVEQMESRDLPLEQILQKYEEGIKLLQHCEKQLSVAERKIELLTRQRDGKVKVSDFEEYETPSSDGENNDGVELF